MTTRRVLFEHSIQIQDTVCALYGKEYSCAENVYRRSKTAHIYDTLRH
jgi:hypothetical protein